MIYKFIIIFTENTFMNKSTINKNLSEIYC